MLHFEILCAIIAADKAMPKMEDNMKKLLVVLLVLITAISLLVSCTVVDTVKESLGISGNQSENNDSSDSNDNKEDLPTDSENNGSEDEKDPEDDQKSEVTHAYNDFTASEKATFVNAIGLVIPFIPNDEYYVANHSTSDKLGVNFYTFGNTEEEFEEYRALFSSWTFIESYEDEYRDTWYCYQNGDVYVEMCYYCYDDQYIFDSYSYILRDIADGFTDAEKELFIDTVGIVIPFIESDEYYVETYTYDNEIGVNYYTYGNTAADFSAYRALFSSWTFVESYEDSYGDTWYSYQKSSIYIDMSYYSYDGDDVIDIYIFILSDDNGGNDSNTSSDFSSSEKEIFTETVGLVIPSIECDEYYVEAYTYDNEIGVNYYTYGNTAADFSSYRALFSSWTFVESYEDIYGDTWYCYQKGDVYADMSYYLYDSEYIIDVYVYVLSTNDDSGNGGNDNDGNYNYTAFTSSEKSLFNSVLGSVIPFIPNNSYYVEEYTYEGEYGINYYTFGNTDADFSAYKALFSSWTFVESYEDDYGDVWYSYYNGSFYVDICHYYYEGDYVVDVYAYIVGENPDGGDNGNTGGGVTNDNVITNEGAGLPTDSDGVYDVDFTQATIVKDVTDQGYYLDGCPTTGSPAVLVIPVDFIDATAESKGYTTAALVNAFSGGAGKTDYYSVHDYYYISSYGKLDLDITVLDFWFRPQNNSSYYENATYDYYGDSIEIGDQLILNEALAYLAKSMDLSKFDSDNNGIIDAVILVNTLDVGDDNFHWAYRYWNVYTDDDGYYYEYDGVSANDYIWASYQFLYESYDNSGNAVYDNPGMNTYTFIHEFGHILGTDDYYDTAYVDHPMNGYDMMDGMTGDHNAYTKFNLGWLTSSRLVVANDNITLTLEDFSKNGDTIIIANNWDPTLGVYQEYYIVVYYTNNGLNAGEDFGYFTRDGIVVYHVNASLYYEVYDGVTYYDVYNNNTHSSDSYGTEDNLLEFVTKSNGEYTYVVGDKLPSVTDDLGNKLTYTFTVDALTDDYATITFTKNA